MTAPEVPPRPWPDLEHLPECSQPEPRRAHPRNMPAPDLLLCPECNQLGFDTTTTMKGATR